MRIIVYDWTELCRHRERESEQRDKTTIQIYHSCLPYPMSDQQYSKRKEQGYNTIFGLSCLFFFSSVPYFTRRIKKKSHVEINIYTNEKSNKFKQINHITHAPMNIPTTQTNQNTFRDRYYATVSAPELLWNCDIDEHFLSFQYISSPQPQHTHPLLYIWLINKCFSVY